MIAKNKDEITKMQSKGFMFRGEFSVSYDLEVLKSNMERRLAFVRGLNPENESVFNAWDIARQSMVQRQL